MPLLVKDRCIGVMDLESPDYDAFGKHDVEVLSALASQVAVAIENARLYEALRANEDRIERELQFRAARAGGAAAGRAAQADARRGRRRALHAGARAGRRPARLPVAGIQQPGRGRRRRVGQGRAGGALQRVCGRAGPLAHVPAPLHARAVQPGGRADVDQHDPVRAAARGLLLHALLRVLRPQAPHADDGQFRAAVSRSGARPTAACRSSCPGCRSGRSPACRTTRSCSSSAPATSSCSAPTASTRRSTRPTRSLAPSASPRSCRPDAANRPPRSCRPSSTRSKASAARRRRPTT